MMLYSSSWVHSSVTESKKWRIKAKCFGKMLYRVAFTSLFDD